MFKKILFVIGTTALVSACSTSAPEIQTGDDAEVIMGNLHKIDNSRADMSYVDPDADFSKYNKILLLPLSMDNVEIRQPDSSGSISRHSSKDWELTDKDKLTFQGVFRDSMVKQLQDKGGYTIVDQPGDDVLTIQASLLGIAPNAPKDDNRSRGAGRTYTYTEGAGSLSVMVAFGDSESGEVLGLMKDSKSSNSYWGNNNSVSNLSDVRTMFNSWAISIRNGLDKVHGK